MGGETSKIKVSGSYHLPFLYGRRGRFIIFPALM
jgi:hypothetical protein